MQQCHIRDWVARGLIAAFAVVCLEIRAGSVVFISDQNVRPGNVVMVPIHFETDNEVFGVQFDVFYDAQQLIASLATENDSSPEGVTVKSSLLAAGHQRLAVYGTGDNSLPSQGLVELSLVIPSDITGDTTVIGLDGLIISGRDGFEGDLEGESRDGILSIVVVPEEVDLTGNVRHYSTGAVMPGVLVHATGENGSDGLTDDVGDFSLRVPSEVPLSLSVDKGFEEPSNRGVTSLDLLLMRRHILGVSPFESPWQRLAADVDRKGDIGAIDLLLMRRLILGLSEGYIQGEPLFEFYPATTEFADPLAPWGVSQTIEYSSLSGDLHQQDFLGVKLGDVDGDWMASSGVLVDGEGLMVQSAAKMNDSVGLFIEDLSDIGGREGEVRRFVVKGSGLESVSALQFSIGWRTDEMVFDSISEAGLSGLTTDHFGLSHSLQDDGLLTFAWAISGSGDQLPEHSASLFVVNFRTLSSVIGDLKFQTGPTPAFAARGLTPTKVISFQSEQMASQGMKLDICSIDRTLSERLIVVELDSEAFMSYSFEYAARMPALEWKSLSVQKGTGQRLRFEDKVAYPGDRFYRVRQFPASVRIQESLK